ncbi:MAG TPA: hypothetical protein VNA12_02395 [Mycobacteriales bacterium]|nr:hypothetical protein [Mycobacteriales bacterium]
MSENEKPIGAAAEDVDDDVDAHGMREVVVGLSAAAVLTGGAAAVMGGEDGGKGGASSIHATNPIDGGDAGPDLTAATGGDIGGATSFTPARAAGSLTQDAVGATTDAVQGTTDAADDDVVSPNRNLMDRVDDRVDGSLDRARDLRDSAVTTAGNTAQETRKTVNQEVRDAVTAVHEAPQTARSAVQDLSSGTVTTPSVREISETATSAVDATLVLAGDTVRKVTGGAMTTLARVQPGVGSNVDVKDASGWVSVTVGGEEVARAEVKDGQASLSWEAPSADAPVTFHYSGSDVLNPTSATL